MKTKFILIISLLIFTFIPFNVKSQSITNSDYDPTISNLAPSFVENYVIQSKIMTNALEPVVFKLLNYNIRATGEFPEWKDSIKEENPDIALLVETGSWKGSDDPALLTIIDEFNSYFVDETPYTGVASIESSAVDGIAILSRFPIVSFNMFGDANLDNGASRKLNRNVIDAIIEIDNVDVHLIGLHLSSGPEANERRSIDLEAIINYIDDLGDVPVIFAGDFNSASPVDIGDIAALEGGLGDDAIKLLLNNSNPRSSKVHLWKDTYRELNPRKPGYTQWWGSRIDYIFVNEFFFDKLVNATVADLPSGFIGSDHYPLDTTFNMNPELTNLRPPFSPYDFKGIVIDDAAISFSWKTNTNEDVEKFKVYRDGTLLGESETPNFNDSGLTYGVIYKYQATSVDNSSNESTLSNPFYINTGYGVLTKPDPVSLQITAGPNQAILDWSINNTGGFEIIEFIVYRASENSLKNGLFKWLGPTTEYRYVDNTAWAGKTWYYYVVTENILGRGNKSELVEVIPFEPITTDSSTDTSSSKEEESFISVYGIFIGLVASVIFITIRRRKNIY